jgi:hypothetical protein
VSGRDVARLAGLASTLTEVDEFLRSPAGHAALTAWYSAAGRIAPEYDAGLLIDQVAFTALTLATHPAGPPRTS